MTEPNILPQTPPKTEKEHWLFIKWFPIFKNNDTFTEAQINEYKKDLASNWY